MAGSCTAAFFFVSGYMGTDLRPYDLHEGLLGLIVHVPVLIVVSLLTSRQSDQHWHEYAGAKT